MGLLKRLEDHLSRKHEQKFQEEVQGIVKTVLEHGFAMNTEDGLDLGEYNFDGCRYTTVGLWTCDMPEFIAYGPLDFADNSVLWEVAAVYLNRGEKPQDGDRVQLDDRVVTLRKVTSPKHIAREMRLVCKVTMETSLEEFVGPFVPVFQVVGDLPPPVTLYEGTPAQTRTVALEYEPKFQDTMLLARKRRHDSQGFRVTTFDVAR